MKWTIEVTYRDGSAPSLFEVDGLMWSMVVLNANLYGDQITGADAMLERRRWSDIDAITIRPTAAAKQAG